MKTDNILLIGAILLMAVSIGCIAYGLEEQSTTEIEEPQMTIPYIIDEEGRLRIVATATIYLNINVGFSDNNDSTED